MAKKYTAETQPYKTSGKHTTIGSASISYSGMTGTGNPHAGGKSGGKPAAISGVPTVQIGGSYEVGTVPAMPGTLRIGENKNVSTPVSGK